MFTELRGTSSLDSLGPTLVTFCVMGKADKKRKHIGRFDPLARPTDGPASMDEDQPPKDEKPLSAHQQRHLERKRLQAEVINLKKQKLKVSKSDKLAWKKEKKGLTKNLRAVQAEAAALRSAPLASAADATPLSSSQHAVPGFKGFDLPMPVHANAASGTSWFHKS